MSTQTHPLILVAAASVTIASLAAAAHFTGLLPGSSTPEKTEPSAIVANVDSSAPRPPAVAPLAAPEVSAAKKPEQPVKPVAGPADTIAGQPRQSAQRKTSQHSEKSTGHDAGIDVIPARSSESARDEAPARQAQSALCHECGTVERVDEIRTEGEGSGLGAIAGGVLGGLLGNQVGKGNGRDVGAIIGAVGGAVAGHQVEKKMRTGKRVEVTVRLDDGSYQTIDQEVAGRWQRGDRVRIEQGRLQSN